MQPGSAGLSVLCGERSGASSGYTALLTGLPTRMGLSSFCRPVLSLLPVSGGWQDCRTACEPPGQCPGTKAQEISLILHTHTHHRPSPPPPYFIPSRAQAPLLPHFISWHRRPAPDLQLHLPPVLGFSHAGPSTPPCTPKLLDHAGPNAERLPCARPRGSALERQEVARVSPAPGGRRQRLTARAGSAPKPGCSGPLWNVNTSQNINSRPQARRKQDPSIMVSERRQKQEQCPNHKNYQPAP